MRLRRRVFMTPDLRRVKWECAVSLLLLDSLTGVRYLPFHLVRPARAVASSSQRAREYIVGV
jgi:hypothetical protein